MSIRLVVSFTAKPGKGHELFQAYQARCQEVMQEPGCEQFEALQSVLDPDRLVPLERWANQAPFDAHAEVNKTSPVLLPDLRELGGEREDYADNGRPR